ncbi:MAG TPA: FAD-binding protein [Anaerolineaceae bacterium]|jgi:succinate dehydrogenase/fumarate reductase flavoprotein subunit
MTQENEAKIVSRRTFLKKTAAISVTAAAASALAACAPAVAAPTSKLPKWDKEVDVLVVGSGTVAMAAIAAKDAGAASVLIIEKGPAFGGTSALSGGGFWIPVNSAMQAAGIEDNRADALKYMQYITDGQSSDELINTYLDTGPKMLQWLTDKHKVQFAVTGTMFQDYYEVPGFRAKGRQVAFAQDGKPLPGAGAWKIIRTICDTIGVEVMLNTAGKKLYTNDAGEVVGVLATGQDGKDLNIHAKKGVILGTGGFDHNPQMMKSFMRGPIQVSNAVPTNTGDGQLMAMAVGADLGNMNSCWGLPSFPLDESKLQGEVDWQMYRGKPGAIVVNKHGERFGNESAAYHTFNRSFFSWDSGKFEWRNIPAFWICDSTFPANYFMPGSNYQMGKMPDWIKKGDTLEDLCKTLGVDWTGFQATLQTFNEDAKNGVDPTWHRGEAAFDQQTAGDVSGKRTELKNNCLAPIEKGPFYGYVYGPGTCGTNGGPRINTNGQVMDVWGNPIPRLYAIGNTCASPMGAGYPGGGGTLGSGSVFGMLAGQHAAGLTALS